MKDAHIRLFPEGVYLLEFPNPRLFESRVSRSDTRFWSVPVKLVGTDHIFWWIAADSDRAKWMWREFDDGVEWQDLPSTLGGRQVLARVIRDSFGERERKQERNRIQEFMVEVLEKVHPPEYALSLKSVN